MFSKHKKTSAAAADVAAAATTPAATAAGAPPAVGHSRPWSASLHTWLVGLTLEPFVNVLDFIVFPASQLEVRHYLETKNIPPDVSNKASRSRCHHYDCCTTSPAEPLQQNSSSSSSRTHEARVRCTLGLLV